MPTGRTYCSPVDELFPRPRAMWSDTPRASRLGADTLSPRSALSNNFTTDGNSRSEPSDSEVPTPVSLTGRPATSLPIKYATPSTKWKIEGESNKFTSRCPAAKRPQYCSSYSHSLLNQLWVIESSGDVASRKIAIHQGQKEHPLHLNHSPDAS